MNKLLAISVVVLFSVSALFADEWVNGYYRKDGTYVSGHYRSGSNSTNHDNYGTSGNYNPYTGESGYRAKDHSSESYNYGGNYGVQTGPRGGQYYINGNGNKVYVPKR